MRHLWQEFDWLLQNGLCVATSWSEIHKKSCNRLETRLNFASEIRNEIDL